MLHNLKIGIFIIFLDYGYQASEPRSEEGNSMYVPLDFVHHIPLPCTKQVVEQIEDKKKRCIISPQCKRSQNWGKDIIEEYDSYQKPSYALSFVEYLSS